jgi:hypothetical protein
MNAPVNDGRPDKAAINSHLYALFPPDFVTDFPDAKIEIAYGPPGNVNRAELFSAHDLEKASAFAAAKSAAGNNVYVGPSLKKGDTFPAARTNDTDFLASIWTRTDSDAEGGPENTIKQSEALNLAPPMMVGTGTIPHQRGHAYYLLEQPVTDGEVLRAANKGLRTRFGGDPVEAPGHVMRLAGTISYPTDAKQKRGYVTEVVTLTVDKQPRKHSPAALAALVDGRDQPRSDAPDTPRKGIEGLLETSREPGNWHNAMRSVVASMVGLKYPDSIIRLACAQYCDNGKMDGDLKTLIDTARKKFDIPDVDAPVPDAPLAATPWKWLAPQDVQPRAFLYGTHYIRQFLSVGFGAPGGGKSTKRMVEAIAMASGRALLGVKPIKKLKVWYWNGEDPQSETDRRFAAICMHFGIKQEEIEGYLFANSGRDMPIVRADRKEPLVVIPLKLAAEIAAKAEGSR